jgi:glycerophosphoryl diester phosphodiesterase
MSDIADLTLVAHRGYPLAFPENTLLGYQQAVIHGATHIETDVQLTRDHVPVLYHDSGTRRLSGVGGSIAGRTLEALGGLSAHHPGRFGDRFAGTPIPTLKSFSGWLAQHPSVTAFVEIKRQPLKRLGAEHVMARVMEALRGVEDRCVIISFDDQCIEHTAGRYPIRTGWVLPAWNRRVQARAAALAPAYLFAEDVQIPAKPDMLWRGPWQWAVYVVNSLADALGWVERGVHLVETDAIGDMLDQYRAGPPGRV